MPVDWFLSVACGGVNAGDAYFEQLYDIMFASRLCEHLCKTLVSRRHSQSSNPRRIAVVLTLTLTLTFQPKTIALAGYPQVIPYVNFEHFGIIRL